MYQLKILMSAHSLFYSSHNYSTRNSLLNLPTPLFTSTAGQRCPSYQLAFLWSNLPTNINQLSNSLKLKHCWKKHLLSSWLIFRLWHQWLMTLTVDCRLSWGQHAISQATVHFGSIIINRCNFFFQILSLFCPCYDRLFCYISL